MRNYEIPCEVISLCKRIAAYRETLTSQRHGNFQRLNFMNEAANYLSSRMRAMKAVGIQQPVVVTWYRFMQKEGS